jgi:hypothetical protein
MLPQLQNNKVMAVRWNLQFTVNSEQQWGLTIPQPQTSVTCEESKSMQKYLHHI